MTETGLAYDVLFLKHQMGAHPENGHRVAHSYAALARTPVFDKLRPLEFSPATREDLLLVHDRHYLDLVAGIPDGEYVALGPDTVIGPGSMEAAAGAAGAAAAAVRAVTEGSLTTAFCMVRPPGHHASPDRTMGFCVFNSVALGAAYALDRCGHERVAIIDFDVHHGNGTQNTFYGDNRVLFVSLHQYPFYPGTGAANETGTGRGEGKNLNIPLPRGSTEPVYLEALRERVAPAVEHHGPSLIMISAGFDAHRADPLAGMNLESESYAAITGAIKEIAGRSASGRVVSVLEGGYNLEALAESVTAHVTALAA